MAQARRVRQDQVIRLRVGDLARLLDLPQEGIKRLLSEGYFFRITLDGGPLRAVMVNARTLKRRHGEGMDVHIVRQRKSSLPELLRNAAHAPGVEEHERRRRKRVLRAVASLVSLRT